MMKEIFVSTSCLGNTRNLRDILEIFCAYGIKNVELGGGLEYIDDIKYINRISPPLNLIIHNYFPPVREPFVMNLAAQDEEIREKSMAVCKRAIELCRHFGAKLYSFHPGFRVEKTLGLEFEVDGRELVNYEDAFSKFVRSIEEILKRARSRRVKIALENLEQKNDAYMMARPDEFARFQEIFPEVGVLLDLGHLKIASRRLGFRSSDFLRAVQGNIFEVHIHENDGTSDLHREPLNGDLIGLLGVIDCESIVLESRGLNMARVNLNLRALKDAIR